MRRILLALATVTAATISCSSPTEPGDDSDVSLQRSTVSASPSSVPANGQASAVVTVTLVDAAGAPYGKSGGALELSTTSGSMSAVSNKGDGTYTATLTSSTAAGIAVVSARIAGASLADTAGVQFLPGPVSAATVANPSTNNQTAIVGASVPNPPSVKVADAFGNGVPDITVTFAVTSGGGTVTGALQKTNASGVATVGGWTLGHVAGANTLTATVSGAAAVRASQLAASTADLTVTFTATAVAGAPGSISLAGGDGQTAVAGTQVTTAPSVKVVDANNNPVSGASVSFFVATGGGSITGASTATNASGIATVGSWTLGNVAGSNTLTAAAAGVSGSVTISAVGIPGAAAAIAIANAGSNNQSAAAGAAVPIPPSVKVTDSRGNAVAGVAVAFAVASGGGTVTPADATTNSVGIASVASWTLGATAGSNTLVATSGSLSGSPITFNATGTAGAPGLITIVAGDAQTAVAGTAAAIAPSVRVSDQNGNAVGGATVTFTVVAGNGSIAGATAVSNASGIATAGIWTLGIVAGENRLAATSGALTAVTFTATGTAGAPALIAVNAGNGQTATAGTNVAVVPSVKVTDANGNVVSGAAVTFAVISGGGSITGANASSNASGIASVGSWTLGTSAGANTLSASLNGVAGATVSFTATGSAIPPLVVSVSGRRERSQTVAVTVTQNGSTLAPSSYTLTLVPADGGQVNGDGTVKLLKTGSLTLTATAGSATGNTAITVAQPPLFVFDLVRAGFRHIWQAALDGGDLVQLTTNGSDNQHGTRVGDKLVFASARSGQNFDIFSMTVSTGVEVNLTSTTSFPENDPTLSPNGQRVTFVRVESGLPRALYMNADGTGVAPVADNSADVGAIETTPAWSPTSDKVIFSRASGGFPDIWIAHTLGGVATKLSAPANGPAADLGAEWNASNAVVFNTYRSGSDEIWITNTTGSTATKLTDGASPAWTLDGRVVFVRYNMSGSGALFWIDPANPSVVHPIDVGGGNAQRPSAVLP